MRGLKWLVNGYRGRFKRVERLNEQLKICIDQSISTGKMTYCVETAWKELFWELGKIKGWNNRAIDDYYTLNYRKYSYKSNTQIETDLNLLTTEDLIDKFIKRVQNINTDGLRLCDIEYITIYFWSMYDRLEKELEQKDRKLYKY